MVSCTLNLQGNFDGNFRENCLFGSILVNFSTETIFSIFPFVFFLSLFFIRKIRVIFWLSKLRRKLTQISGFYRNAFGFLHRLWFYLKAPLRRPGRTKTSGENFLANFCEATENSEKVQYRKSTMWILLCSFMAILTGLSITREWHLSIQVRSRDSDMSDMTRCQNCQRLDIFCHFECVKIEKMVV